MLRACFYIVLYHILLARTQTAIDIFAKHAYDNVNRFTLQQRDAIVKLWNSIKEQQIRRKQGKSVSGKLDVMPSSTSRKSTPTRRSASVMLLAVAASGGRHSGSAKSAG